MRPTFLDLFEIILKAVETSPQSVVFQVKLGLIPERRTSNLGKKASGNITIENPAKRSFTKTEIRSGAS